MSEVAEASVLQGLVSDPSLVDSIAYLKPYMFQKQIYKDLYETFLALNEGKTEYGIQTVVSRLAAGKNDYTETFLMEFVRDNLITGAFGAEIQSHAKVVFDDYKKRATIAAVKEYHPDTNNIDADLQELIGRLQDLQITVDDDGKSLAEVTEEIKDNYFKPKTVDFLEFGIRELDEAIGGIDGGDMVIIAARPGVGKSAFTLQSMRHFSAQGKRVAYFNLEMLRQQVFERAVASASGLQMTAIRRNTRFHNNEKADYERGVQELLEEKNIVIYQGKWSVSQIRAVQAQKKYDVIVIDYMQLLTPEGNRGGNRTAEVGDISRGLKTIAMDYNIPIVALSQINRASEVGKTKEPNMTELRESGSIEQDASVIIMIWQNDEDDTDSKGIKVEKARNGKPHKMTMRFDGAHMTFDVFEKLHKTEFRKVTDADDLVFD